MPWKAANERVHLAYFPAPSRRYLYAFSILFIVYSRNTGQPFFTYWAPFFLAGGALLLGTPAYLAQRGKMTEPQAVPEYR